MKKLLASFLFASFAFAGLAQAETISGTIHFAGKVPEKSPVANVPPACGSAPIYDQSIVAGKGLANVVVYLDAAPAGATAAPKDVTIEQKGCVYEPHVQAAVVGSKLTITNQDATLHTAHAYSKDGSTMWNVATPMQGFKSTKSLDTAGAMTLKCDAGHTWMNATVFVLPHAFYSVTDANGSFSIENVPPGTYTLKTWHEKLGEQSTQVTVSKGKNGHAELSYK